jgi:catechol 2,3-dioxygenase-like lactoylglutathione lyase family enzyme
MGGIDTRAACVSRFVLANAPTASRIQINKLAHFTVVTPDADRLALFYRRAFGFSQFATETRSGPDFEQLMGVTGGARSVMLGLGRQLLELLQFDRPGRPYPPTASSSDLIFQHFAIVVADIGEVWQKLSTVSGWSAISTDGPQRLPQSSGGVTAFKFRDPDGHPLELLAFSSGHVPANRSNRGNDDLCLGIDHSAIGVSESARSIAFYETLGLRVAARSLNRGLEQTCLDAVDNACVEVTALVPRRTTPHIELLCYRSIARDRSVLHNNDVAATRLVLEAVGPLSEDESVNAASLTDPDGHHLVIVSRITSDAMTVARAAPLAVGPAYPRPATVKPEIPS